MPTASGNPTLIDIAKERGVQQEGYVMEAIAATPELDHMPVDGIPGQQYSTLVCTTLPTVDFRLPNEGAADSKPIYEPRTVETHILNPSWGADKAVADIHPKGPQYMIARDGKLMVSAAMLKICSQMYYGGSAKGFQGLTNFVDSSLVVDATGSTANSAFSVWALKFGVDDVQLVLGGNSQLDVTDPRVTDYFDSSGNRHTRYVQEMLAWVGIQVMNKWSVGRIKNLTTQSGKGLTDSLLSQLLETFPTGHLPDLFITTRRGVGQLQRSRTATNATGAEAPRPTSYEGIPIIASEALVNTEAIS